MVTGTIKSSGIVLTDISVEFKGANAWDIQAKAKLVNTASGQTYASTSAVNWPPEVVQKVRELATVMEAALAKYMFTDAPSINTSTPYLQANAPVSIPSDGLGDYLKVNDPKSI